MDLSKGQGEEKVVSSSSLTESIRQGFMDTWPSEVITIFSRLFSRVQYTGKICYCWTPWYPIRSSRTVDIILRDNFPAILMPIGRLNVQIYLEYNRMKNEIGLRFTAFYPYVH